MDRENQGATSESPAVNVFRAPAFCNQEPSIWFSLIESSFLANRITSSLVKFSHATALLPPDVLSQVSDIIAKAVLSNQPYEDLKSATISRLETPFTTRLQELLSKEELGNERPTGLLRRMKKLLGDKYDQFDKAMFLQLFYQRLPPTIQRNFFIVKNKLDIDELAELADEFLQSTPGDQVASVNEVQSQPYTHLVDLVSRLSLQIESLQTQVRSLQTQVDNIPSQGQCSRSHQRFPSRSPPPPRKMYYYQVDNLLSQDRSSRSRQRFPSRSPPPPRQMCYYHQTFKAAAKKCDPPCSFNKSALNSEGRH